MINQVLTVAPIRSAINARHIRETAPGTPNQETRKRGNNEGRHLAATPAAHLLKRIEDLTGREASYWEDELFSFEALTNLSYRDELERCIKLDPLGPLPPRI